MREFARVFWDELKVSLLVLAFLLFVIAPIALMVDACDMTPQPWVGVGWVMLMLLWVFVCVCALKATCEVWDR